MREWSDLDRLGDGDWLCLNFEALKCSPACGIDPRGAGEALWPERQSAALLESKRRLDPLRFEVHDQGHRRVAARSMATASWRRRAAVGRLSAMRAG